VQALLGADIAASTTRTGAAARGGDWELGFLTPGMEAARLALSAEARMAYGGILASLNAADYGALKALYESTGGGNWLQNGGWRDWDFSVRFVLA